MSTSPASDGRDQRIAELERQLAEAQALLRTLQEPLAELERAGKRQATPFARRERQANPKKPGRKAGQRRFTYRAQPEVRI